MRPGLATSMGRGRAIAYSGMTVLVIATGAKCIDRGRQQSGLDLARSLLQRTAQIGVQVVSFPASVKDKPVMIMHVSNKTLGAFVTRSWIGVCAILTTARGSSYRPDAA